MSRRGKKQLVATVFALVVATILVVFVPAFNSIKREDARAQAEYTAETEAYEQELQSRDEIAYTVKKGEGLNNAFVASRIRPELGRTDSMKYEVCVSTVLHRNNLGSGSLPEGRVIKVPLGTKKTVQK